MVKAFAIVGVALTPMLEGLVLLSLAIGLRGVGQGLNLPLMISIGVPRGRLTAVGRVAALRISFNWLGRGLVPYWNGGARRGDWTGGIVLCHWSFGGYVQYRRWGVGFCVPIIKFL